MYNTLRNDYSPLRDLRLDAPPVGVKFSFFRPEGIPPLEADAALPSVKSESAVGETGRLFFKGQ